jgi:LemA protein
MSTLLIILIALAALFVIPSLLLIGNYNKLVHTKNLTAEGWSGIDVQLKRRYDLIPNLVSVAKQYGLHEKNILEEVTRLRSQAVNTSNPSEKATAENNLSQALRTVFAVAENYPDLKANELFLNLQKELGTLEHEIQLSRRYYNGAARNYNTLVSSFPTNIIANFFQFKAVQYFEIADVTQRETPKTF